MDLEEVAKVLSKDVEPLLKRNLIYEANEPDTEFEMEVLEEYQRAIDVVFSWMVWVLTFELVSCPETSTTWYALLVPGGSILIDTPPEDEFGDDCTSKSTRDRDPYMANELIQTPIGQLDHFAWSKIKSIDPNPVSLFYLKMGAEARKLHKLLKKRGVDDPLLTRDVLIRNGIHDPVQIFRCSNVWLGVEKFLKAKMI